MFFIHRRVPIQRLVPARILLGLLVGLQRRITKTVHEPAKRFRRRRKPGGRLLQERKRLFLDETLGVRQALVEPLGIFVEQPGVFREINQVVLKRPRLEQRLAQDTEIIGVSHVLADAREFFLELILFLVGHGFLGLGQLARPGDRTLDLPDHAVDGFDLDLQRALLGQHRHETRVVLLAIMILHENTVNILIRLLDI